MRFTIKPVDFVLRVAVHSCNAKVCQVVFYQTYCALPDDVTFHLAIILFQMAAVQHTSWMNKLFLTAFHNHLFQVNLYFFHISI